MVARIASVSGADQGLVGDQIRQVAGGGGGGGTGNRHVIAGAEAAFEAGGTFAKQAQERFVLARVKLVAQAIEQAGLGDQEFYAGDRFPVGFERRFGEPNEPSRHFQAFIGGFERRVVTLTAVKNSGTQGDQNRLIQPLRQSFFGERPRDASVAVFKRVNRDEV